MHEPSALVALVTELGGAGLVAFDAAATPEGLSDGVVAVGVHRAGPRPEAPAARFDILLTSDPGAPAPWVSLDPAALDAALAELADQAARQPVATAALAQVLRLSLQVSFAAALAAESLAFSMLLASAGFRAWRAATPRRNRTEPDRPRVSLSEADGVLYLELDRADRRNAVDARMRDELCEALDAALVHPNQPALVIRGRGPNFSAGGDLDEFGTAPDPGEAHLVRMLRSPAQRLHALGDRAEVRLHGACIGAGVEIPAAAARVAAQANARFRLPEVAMGLIPGAGGTVTLPRRIGRHRTCYMALSGAEIDAGQALAWGLIDEVAP
jgi:enoyl-CoA hydratase/carnithine racemase